MNDLNSSIGKLSEKFKASVSNDNSRLSLDQFTSKDEISEKLKASISNDTFNGICLSVQHNQKQIPNVTSIVMLFHGFHLQLHET